MGGLTEIEKHRLNRPNDISVVGYDGIYLSRILRPTLTTYVQNSAEIGKQAALKLVEQIEHPKDFEAKEITISGKLQKGSTVKNIKKDRKSTRLNSSHVRISYAVFCLK